MKYWAGCGRSHPQRVPASLRLRIASHFFIFFNRLWGVDLDKAGGMDLVRRGEDRAGGMALVRRGEQLQVLKELPPASDGTCRSC